MSSELAESESRGSWANTAKLLLPGTGLEFKPSLVEGYRCHSVGGHAWRKAEPADEGRLVRPPSARRHLPVEVDRAPDYRPGHLPQHLRHAPSRATSANAAPCMEHSWWGQAPHTRNRASMPYAAHSYTRHLRELHASTARLSDGLRPQCEHQRLLCACLYRHVVGNFTRHLDKLPRRSRVRCFTTSTPLSHHRNH
jgi:hypothetical protein